MSEPISFPTPISDANGLSIVSTVEDQDQHRNKRQKMYTDEAGAEDKLDTEQRSSPSGSGPQNPNVATERSQETVNSDGTEVVSATNQGVEGSHLVSDNVSLEQLRKDMGEAFLLCKSSKTLIPSLF